MRDAYFVGMTTGRHHIRDINRFVPFRTAVRFSSDEVIRSKDLQVALQQGRIMKVEGHFGAPPPQTQVSGELQELRSQVAALTTELQEERAKNAQLQAMTSRFDEMMKLLKVLPSQIQVPPPIVQQVPVHTSSTTTASSTSTAPSKSEPNMPLYIPSVVDKTVKTDIKVQEEAGSTDLSDAKSALKKLRGKK
jgi:hypothetical protein